ncbi:MAG: RagB/SusD family nutrient uptake outer membrane protein, partial [Dysgonamonadaceae bacterium]|nr:RagB/SusD family nutrient uptake outer membrane protein [Dysgonamonadaceae bacterium]
MKYLRIIYLISALCFTVGCADFMDIVPDDVATLETAFTNRQNAEKFLFTCFSYLPNPVNISECPALIGGDEIWWDIDVPGFETSSFAYMAKGLQNTNDPYMNYWDGGRNGKNLFTGIRDCNIFLENIHTPPDLEDYERDIWIAEVKFLKAYYHFYLLQLYGPIPIVRENLPVNALPEEVRIYREPVDYVINYIVELIDEATPQLPFKLVSQATDAGRITQPIALALKAKVLTWAASPLLNNNPYYANVKDNRGVQLFPVGSVPDNVKWEKAAVALKNAIDTCHLAGNALYTYEASAATEMSDETVMKYTIRGIVTQKFNSETIWPSTYGTGSLQKYCMPKLGAYEYVGGISEISATLKIA